MSQDKSNSKILRKHSNKFSGRSDCSIVPGSFYLLPALVVYHCSALIVYQYTGTFYLILTILPIFTTLLLLLTSS